MAALNAVGLAVALHLLGGFYSVGEPMMQAWRAWTFKGGVANIDETFWGKVMLVRHLFQHSGGVTFCPLEEAARFVGCTATPPLASLTGLHVYQRQRQRLRARPGGKPRAQAGALLCCRHRPDR